MALSFQWLKLLPGFVSTMILLVCWSDKVVAEWTEWFADSEISYIFEDNINHAVFDVAEESDQTWNGMVSAGRVYQLSENTRFFADIRLDGNVHQEFDRLNQFTPSVSFSARHKFGIGPYQPWISGTVSTSYIFSRSRIREGYTTTAGFNLGKALHDRVDIALSYRFDYRNSRNTQIIDSNKLIAASIEPEKSSNVYDINGHSIGIQLNALITQQWLMTLSYNFRKGDIVSSNSPGLVPRINNIVKAIVIDDALPGWAYRAEGYTHRYSVDANYAFFKGHAAFNMGYEFVESYASSFTYQNNLLRVNFNYSF